MKDLKKYGQEQILKFYDELTDSQKAQLENQINDINFDNLEDLTKEYVLKEPKIHIPDDLTPAPFFTAEPKNEKETEYYTQAFAKGEELISQGKVAALTVAGGQGSRLGFDGPKGTYPITPIQNKTLFQYFSEKILRLNEKYNTQINWFVMTSLLNNEDTQSFFKDNDFFGLNSESVHFFTQGTMPAIGYDGKLLLASKDSLALAPDGHGGTLLALRNSQSLEKMKALGVEHISYFQVDNPLVSIANPLFIGLHALENSEISAIMLPKTNPYEKLGNFCISKGRTEIIEYSDLPAELAEQRNEDGSLKFLAGSPAIHVLSREFVENLTDGGKLNLPWHRADKKINFINDKGESVTPTENNGVKLESFIFDALPLAKNTMILEAKRENEFAPTKNPSGVDSVESCRQMLIDRDAKWLEAAGVAIPKNSNGEIDCKVELSPKLFVSESDVIEYAKNNNLQAPKAGESVYYA